MRKLPQRDSGQIVQRHDARPDPDFYNFYQREMQAIASRQPAEPMLTGQERLQTLARCMSVNRHKQLAIEYVSTGITTA